MSGILAAGAIIGGGTALYSGYMQNKAAKKTAEAMRDNVQTFDPVRPNAPQTVDWRSAVNDALRYNTNHLGEQQQLASRMNAFNTGQAQRMYRTFQPGFDSLQRQIGQNALSFSQGQLPADVVASIGRSAASRGLQSGFGQGARGGGSGTALGNSLLRGLGLTSLDLSKFGTNLAMQASMQAKQLSPGLFDPSSLMVSPQQAVGYQMQNAQIQNDADRYWNTVQNQALMGNVGAQNTANTNALNTGLAGDLASAQAIQQAGSSVGSGMMQYATSQPSAASSGIAPNGGSVPGYGYNVSNGYYKLS